MTAAWCSTVEVGTPPPPPITIHGAVVCSHHPLNHKLDVIRTLYDRCDHIVIEDAVAVAEIIHVDNTLARCGYLKWSFWRERESMDTKKVGRWS